MKTGILLFNLGTPDNPSPEMVKTFLKEFLMDPDVVDIPFFPARWFLVNQVILRTRPRNSSEAYKKIWTDRGSPLRFHSLDLRNKLHARFKDLSVVELAMRYGNPSLESCLVNLKRQDVDKLVLFPLYPQYAKSSVGSSVKHFTNLMHKLNWSVPTKVIPPFYDSPNFTQAWIKISEPHLKTFNADHILFSFHGLPERHVKETDKTRKHCLASPQCCDKIVDANRHCYRAQSFATARSLAAGLDLKPDQYTVCFQSRLGRTPWIKPYTDYLLKELAEKGVRRLAVICPAFVADCLETLEEIGIRGRESFIGFGGEELLLVPSLNSEDIWVDAAYGLIQNHI